MVFPNLIHLHCNPPLSLQTSMEVAKIFLLENDENNKENVPPFSSTKKSGPYNQKLNRASVKINKRRRPLKDITNVYSVDFPLLSSISVSVLPSNRKRKLVIW